MQPELAGLNPPSEAPPPATCSQAEFARLQGWARSYVTKLKDEGRLVIDGKRVDIAASLARIRATTARPEIASAPAVSSSARTDRDRQAEYDAERMRLDLVERVESLLERDQVHAAVARAQGELEDALGDWPERLAPTLAALAADEGRLRAHLAEHVELELEQIAARMTSGIVTPPAPAAPPMGEQRGARDRQAFYDAERSRLELEERLGRLLRRDQVLDGIADAAVKLRTALEAWPERLAPALATLEGDVGAIRAQLAQQMSAELGRFAAALAAIDGASGGGAA